MNQVIDAMNGASSRNEDFLFAIDYECSKGIFIAQPKLQHNVFWKISNHSNISALQPKYRPGSFFHAHPISFAEYQQKFNIIQHHLMHGNSFLANLTIQTPVSTDYSLQEIFLRSNAPYLLYIPDEMVCFSPERFVTYHQGVMRSNPMKGTISGEIEHAEQLILDNYKEQAEHNTIVDFVRCELSRIGTNVKVERLRYIDTLHTSKGRVLQVSSEISAQVFDQYKQRLGDLIRALLPAASICGAPKEATLKAIAQAEEHPRGFYTGVFGYYDGQTLESAVMIRFIEQQENRLFFRSGGGVTINSVCREEYEEVIQKIYLPFAAH